MFAKRYFAKVFMTGSYWPPLDGGHVVSPTPTPPNYIIVVVIAQNQEIDITMATNSNELMLQANQATEIAIEQEQDSLTLSTEGLPGVVMKADNTVQITMEV